MNKNIGELIKQRRTENKMTLKAVSYTHLDVYKRQPTLIMTFLSMRSSNGVLIGSGLILGPRTTSVSAAVSASGTMIMESSMVKTSRCV